jgi:membrane protein YqaA with SNARE-associated domain
MIMDKDWQKYLTIVAPISLVAIGIGYFVPELRRLVLLFFYSIPANSFVPVPHELGMIYFGQYYTPSLVALVAAAGTVTVCFIDYQAVNFAFGLKHLQKVKQTDLYRGAIQYFLKAPFVSLVAAAAMPFIPFYIFRVLSPTAGYPLRRYMLAIFIGRLPRYYVFALMGSTLDLPSLAVVLAAILGVCWLLYARVSRHLVNVARGEEEAEVESVVPSKTPEETVIA